MANKIVKAGTAKAGKKPGRPATKFNCPWCGKPQHGLKAFTRSHIHVCKLGPSAVARGSKKNPK